MTENVVMKNERTMKLKIMWKANEKMMRAKGETKSGMLIVSRLYRRE